MIRKIIHIDEEKCNGCGLCAEACHEGAIGMVNGKAVLMRDDYCDGLGDCLPACPTGAITFTEREAAAYDHAAVQAHLERRREAGSAQTPKTAQSPVSQLRQWPVQIKLAPVNAPYFQDADLLIAADCTAYSFGDFHDRFMRGRITLIGCPKLDEGDYSQKLAAILTNNPVRSLTVVRMEVPCCGGIVRAVEDAVRAAEEATGRKVPVRVFTLSTEGEIL